MQRELSSFDIYVITQELQEIIGFYVEKIHQPAKNELIIKLKKSGEKNQIFARNEKFICLTNKKIKALQKPTTFAMTLRKYLVNGKISSIKQQEFDRILKIGIRKKEGEYTLVFEFFSKGNIILVNPDGKIVYPLKVQHWSHRSIKPHIEYIPPPTQTNPFTLSFDEFEKILTSSKKDIVRTLAVNLNLSGKYAEEICYKLDIDKNKKIAELLKDEIKKIFAAIAGLIRVFKEKKIDPYLVLENTKIMDVLPLKFESYKQYDMEKIASFTRGLEGLIEVRESKRFKPSSWQLKVDKLNRQLVQQKKAVVEFKEKITLEKNQGDLLYLNFQLCTEILEEIQNVLKKKEKANDVEKINKKDAVKLFDPESNVLILMLNDKNNQRFDVPLDFRKNVAKNAEIKYNTSKKLGEKIKGAQDAIENTEQKIKQLKKKKVLEKEKDAKKEFEKHFWFERFHWFISNNGNVVIGGRDAKSNELVVKKYLKEGDRYVHADVTGAPSCIVKSCDVQGKTLSISKETLKEACIFAGCYSKAWKQFSETQVYWVLPEQVSKTPQSGEFVPRGAFIIRGKRNYHNVKLEMAVGEIKLEDTTKIIGASVDTVKHYSQRYVVVVPGGKKKQDIAKKLAGVFGISSDEFMRVLPGDVEIIDSVGCQM